MTTFSILLAICTNLLEVGINNIETDYFVRSLQSMSQLFLPPFPRGSCDIETLKGGREGPEGMIGELGTGAAPREDQVAGSAAQSCACAVAEVSAAPPACAVAE